MSITYDMREALRGDRRKLCWMFWIEGQSSDLYAWSGAHTITYDGQNWIGVGAVLSAEAIRRTDSLEHVTQAFTINGLDPSIIAGLDTSVRGRSAKIWLGTLNDKGQIIRDPLLIQELQQETMSLDRRADDTVSITLPCFEALPFVGRASRTNWSHEAWQSERDDEGFYYNRDIAAGGPAVNWQQDT